MKTGMRVGIATDHGARLRAYLAAEFSEAPRHLRRFAKVPALEEHWRNR